MDLERVKELAHELKDKRSRKAELEDELKTINADIKSIEEGSLNTLLSEEGVDSVKVDGMKIDKSFVYRGGVYKSQNKEDFQFLFDTANEGALKQHLIIDLSNEAASEAEFVLGMNSIPYSIVYEIHNATLSSILKKLVEDGELDTEDFEKYRIYPQPRISIK